MTRDSTPDSAPLDIVGSPDASAESQAGVGETAQRPPSSHASAAFIENVPFDEIAVGARASIVRTLRREDIDLFAIVSGDVNPAHLDPAFAATGLLHHIVGHGMWTGALISSVLGTKLPGPGTVYLSQCLDFLAPVAVDDVVTASVTVVEKEPRRHRVTLDCRCTNQAGQTVATGRCRVIAPTEKIRRPRVELPDVRLSRHERFRALMAAVAGRAAVRTAVAHPCTPLALGAVAEAAKAGLLDPILVGPERKIRIAADAAGVDISGYELVPTPHSHAAAAEAVALVRSGRAALLMKGSLHTDELMHEVLADATGLRTGRRVSHVYLMDVPAYPRPLIVTDAAINIAPTLEDKVDIVQNAIDFAHAMGVTAPRVAILSAVETLSSSLPSTLDAAALCKMADRGQIVGAVLDGPLAFDTAISAAAAKEKEVVSAVAGAADILVVPNLEAGNILAKQLTFMAGADAAGLVLGARVPIILTSRADGARTRLASCAIAIMMVSHDDR